MPDVTLCVLDLFAGRGTATKAFRDRGWEVVTVEIDPQHRPDIVGDIGSWNPPFKPGHFDFIWASPPCTTFSLASGGRHFRREDPRRVRWHPEHGPGHGHDDRHGHDVAGGGHVDMAKPAPEHGHARQGHLETSSGHSGGHVQERKSYRFRRSRMRVGEVYPITPAAVEAVILVEKTLALIDYLKPSFWVMENPRSVLRSIIGPPTVTTSYCRWGMDWLKPTDLWGDPPPGIDWNSRLCHPDDEEHHYVRNAATAIERSEVPYGLGFALAETAEFYFLDGPLI